MEATPNTGYWQIPATPTPEPTTPTLAPPPPPPAPAPTKRKGLWIAAGVAAVIVPIAAVLIGIGIGSNSTTDAATSSPAPAKPLTCGAGTRPSSRGTFCEVIPATTTTPATTSDEDLTIAAITWAWNSSNVCNSVNEAHGKGVSYDVLIQIAIDKFGEGNVMTPAVNAAVEDLVYAC